MDFFFFSMGLVKNIFFLKHAIVRENLIGDKYLFVTEFLHVFNAFAVK